MVATPNSLFFTNFIFWFVIPSRFRLWQWEQMGEMLKVDMVVATVQFSWSCYLWLSGTVFKTLMLLQFLALWATLLQNSSLLDLCLAHGILFGMPWYLLSTSMDDCNSESLCIQFILLLFYFIIMWCFNLVELFYLKWDVTIFIYEFLIYIKIIRTYF